MIKEEIIEEGGIFCVEFAKYEADNLYVKALDNIDRVGFKDIIDKRKIYPDVFDSVFKVNDFTEYGKKAHEQLNLFKSYVPLGWDGHLLYRLSNPKKYVDPTAGLCCEFYFTAALVISKPIVNIETLDDIFSYHAPKGDQPQRYEKIRNAGKEFAKVVLECTPKSEDRSVAIRKIREAIMTANAAIAINE